MNPAKTIQLFGFNEKDEVIFSTLLSLLSSKTVDEWALIEKGISDVLIVDMAADKARLVAEDRERRGQQVIRLVAGSGAQSGLVLGKPLRAADILRCLNGLRAEQAATVVPVAEPRAEDSARSSREPAPASPHQGSEEISVGGLSASTVVRLNRWPPKFIQQRASYSARLCAVMMHHPVSLKKAASMANAPLAEAVEFVAYCLERNYAYVVPIGRDVAPQKDESGKQNLFEKLRLKFAVRN